MDTIKDVTGCLFIVLGIWLTCAVAAFGLKYGWNLADKTNAPEIQTELIISGD